MAKITETKGWKGMELKVGMAVEVDPEAVGGPENPQNVPGKIEGGYLGHVYANGEEVRVDSPAGKFTVPRTSVRPRMSSEERERMRNEDMGECHSNLRERVREFISGVEDAYDGILNKLIQKTKNTYDLAYEIQWHGEDWILAGVAQQVLAENGITGALKDYAEGGDFQVMVDKVREGREHAAKRALDHPYRHSSTGTLHNLFEECKHRVACELGGGSGFTFHFLHELGFYAGRLERIANEW